MIGISYMVAVSTHNIEYDFKLFSLSSNLVYAYFLMCKNYNDERCQISLSVGG
jgi:hypothetical protein